MKLIKTKLSMNSMINFSAAAVILAVGFLIGSLISVTPSTAAGNIVGFVNIESLIDQHPGMERVALKVNEYKNQELKKLEKYSGGNLTEKERRESLDLTVQIRDNILAKQKELSKPILDDIMAKSRKVGREIGVEVVLDGAVVLYGGIDLTPAVADILEKNV